MFGSPLLEDFSVPFAGNRDNSTTPKPTQEYLSCDDNLDLDASEMAMLELLVLCDSSGASCGFYDDLLTLSRRDVKKGFIIISKAKGQDSFVSDMRKRFQHLNQGPQLCLVMRLFTFCSLKCSMIYCIVPTL
jgi:hypothetical protein